jgi:hypothetical protein
MAVGLAHARVLEECRRLCGGHHAGCVGEDRSGAAVDRLRRGLRLRRDHHRPSVAPRRLRHPATVPGWWRSARERAVNRRRKTFAGACRWINTATVECRDRSAESAPGGHRAAGSRRGCREIARRRFARAGSGWSIRTRGRRRRTPQAGTAARRWWWSFSRLCVAAMNRHSLLQADLPRRWKRLIWRLNLSWPNTGSMVIWRWR